ncbi:MAG: DUF547 domain-containing protein [Calditrichota bacterium]
MMNMKRKIIAMLISAVLLGFGSSLFANATGTVHDSYDALLQKYVKGFGFDYAALAKSDADKKTLSTYVDALEALNPDDMNRSEAFAYWINLYNAATLELVIQNYPLKSIKDIGGIFKSPWKRKVVTVAGKELTLDNIEHDIMRPTFKDARLHFAVNCASIGCPPLSNRAYSAETLNEQLDAASKAALNDERWVKITDGKLELSKLFDWFKDDFTETSGSVRKYLATYVAEDKKAAVLNDSNKIRYKSYDWKLNSAN